MIKSNGPPDQITQKPFDFDSSHYRRLCNLNDVEPNGSDLYDYALDMRYMELQPELLRCLMPVLLRAWQRDLFEGSAAGYAGFVEEFWPALLKGSALTKVFNSAEHKACADFMCKSILDRMDEEKLLHFEGMNSSPYAWIQAFVSYGTVFDNVEAFWSEWWEFETPGQATAAFQYASALMYDEKHNPVFEPWSKDNGGGPPALCDCGVMMFDAGWKLENILFLKRTLSAEYIGQKLNIALGRISDSDAKRIASSIVQDFHGQRARLELRIEQLPELLADVSRVEGFQI